MLWSIEFKELFVNIKSICHNLALEKSNKERKLNILDLNKNLIDTKQLGLNSVLKNLKDETEIPYEVLLHLKSFNYFHSRIF